MTSALSVGVLPMHVALVFLAWTVTSFMCHELAKTFLSEASQVFASGGLMPFQLAFLLTAIQCSVCLMMVRSPVFSPASDDYRIGALIVTSHFLATLTTNCSMAYIQAASTFAIKLTEPVVMAIAKRLAFGTPVTVQTILSLPLIIVGALTFSGANTGSLPDSRGVFLAFTSNVALAFRNVAIRYQQEKEKSPSKISLRSVQSVFLALLSLGVTTLVVRSLEDATVLGVTSTGLLWLALTSGLCHVAYSYLSTGIVLKMLDVVSHSVCNIFKRLLVVWLLYSCGARAASIWNFLGLALAVFGLVIYLYGKLTPYLTTSQWPAISLSGVVKSGALVALSIVLILVGLKSSQCGKELGLGLLPGRVVSPGVTYLVSRNAESEDFGRKLLSSWDQSKTRVELPDVSVNEFKSWRLLQHPNQTDFLSRVLKDNRAIVDEAQRVLLNLLSDIIDSANHVMLIEIAIYENKGDPAISVGEAMLLRKLNKTVVFYCETSTCTDANLDYAQTIDRKYPPNHLVILMQGGGNLVGYELNDVIRGRVLKRFPHRRVVLLSQSIWLHSNNSDHLQECVQIYSNRSNLIMFLRDRQSLALAREHFKGTQLVLAPDMAFGIGLVSRQLPPTQDIIWLHRSDEEYTGHDLPDMPKDLVVHRADYYHKWKSNRGTTHMESSFLIASAGLQFLQRGRVVITDRLHGHILSTLLGIPHVLVDNPPYFKLSSFHQSWTQSLHNVVMVTNGSQALLEARTLLRHFSNSLPPVAPYMRAPSGKPKS